MRDQVGKVKFFFFFFFAGTQTSRLHEIGIGAEFRRVSDETSAIEVAGVGLLESAEQVAGPEFPLHANETDHHRLQNAQSGNMRLRNRRVAERW